MLLIVEAIRFSNSEMNKQIEDSYKANTNLMLTAQDICEGGQLAKWSYR